ncbi:MAG: hypothetical protein KKD44_28410 [Proteobacteria bacterium]|nr:hypothetical protein [Pseudomonadota bacterium]
MAELILRFPCEYYIKYLLVTRGRSGLDDLVRIHKYPEPQEVYINYLVKQLSEGKPGNASLDNPKTIEWMRRHRISAFNVMEPNLGLQDALNINTAYMDARYVLEMLIMSNLPVPDLHANFMKALPCYTRIPEEIVYWYKHFFWNRDLLTVQEWETFLVKLGYQNGENLFLAYLSDAEFTLYKLGLIKKIGKDSDGKLNDLSDMVYVKAMEMKLLPNNPLTAAQIKNLADVAIKSAGITKLTEIEVFLKELKGIAMKFNTVPPGYDALPPGNRDQIVGPDGRDVRPISDRD